MSYEEIISFARENLKKTVSKNSAENTAVEFNIYGEGEGAFYIEIKDGKVSLEPIKIFEQMSNAIVEKPLSNILI